MNDDIEAYAKYLAFNYGFEWARLDPEERDHYRDEAERCAKKDELPTCVWGDAEYPFCKNY